MAYPAGQAVGRRYVLTASPVAMDNQAIEQVPDAQRMTALLRRVAATADRAAFSELYAFYGPRLRTYMRKLGADGAAAEDLAQDVMAAVWNKAKLFDPAKASASTWIFTIARNLRIDLIRRERRPQVDDLDIPPEESLSPEGAVISSRDAEAVRAALLALPQDQADVIRLSFFEDRPHGAIAAELGVPLGTVKSRLRLAFRRFRKILREPE